MRRTLTAFGFLSLFGLVAALLVVIAYDYGRRDNFTGVDTLSASFIFLIFDPVGNIGNWHQER